MNFLLETVLSAKYDFVSVQDVYDGADRLRKKDIQLVIADLDYHTEEIWDFIEHIQTSSLYPEMKFIMLASDKGDQYSRSLDSEFVFFSKPFSPLELLSRVDELIYEKSIKAN